MKTYTIGDIHGAHKALLQVIERSGINKESDQLICLGDVADGWPEVPQCFEELLGFKNLIYIMGNHDKWLWNWFDFGTEPAIWTEQGGRATIEAYRSLANHYIEDEHKKLLYDSRSYYITDNDILFVHGGFYHRVPIEEQKPKELMWDRDLYYNFQIWEGSGYPKKSEIDKYNKIFIGHTTTSRDRPDLTPVNIGKLWNIDQGAGWEGKLTLMDVDTNEYWQSDTVKSLYPDVKGR